MNLSDLCKEALRIAVKCQIAAGNVLNHGDVFDPHIVTLHSKSGVS